MISPPIIVIPSSSTPPQHYSAPSPNSIHQLITNSFLAPLKYKWIHPTLGPFKPVIARISLNNEYLTIHSLFKYFGVLLNSKLTWKPHIENGIQHPQTPFPTPLRWWPLHLSAILQSIFRNILNYASILCSNATKPSLTSLKRVQNHTMRRGGSSHSCPTTWIQSTHYLYSFGGLNSPNNTSYKSSPISTSSPQNIIRCSFRSPSLLSTVIKDLYLTLLW